MQTKNFLIGSGIACLMLMAACGGGGDDDGGGGDPGAPLRTTDYRVEFSAAQVIGASAAPDTVTATAALSSARGDGTTASGSVTVSGITATSVSINVGYAGETGPVAVTLTDGGGGTWNVPSGTEIADQEFFRLDAAGYYVWIETPEGALRGQILPQNWIVAIIELDADSVVPASISTGAAKAGLSLDAVTSRYRIRMSVSGVSDSMSAAVRNAIAGARGDIVISLEQSATDPDVWGSGDINNVNVDNRFTLSGLDLLASGALYLSLESATNMQGDLRGQLIDETIRVFDTEMTSSAVVTGGAPVVSTAEGHATSTWVEALSKFGIAVNTDTPDAVSVGVYEGIPGENGTLVFALMQDAVLTGNWQFPPTDLSTEQVASLENGNFYVSINTATNPGGELRGQLDLQPPEATVVMIGTSGGVVNTPDGVSLQVPAGALAETQPISVRRLQGTGALPAPFADPIVPLHAAVEFGPAGLEFALPVTLSIDLEKAAPPGASQPMLVHDPEAGTWQETEFIATASNDGASATVDLTHFSDYAVTFSEKGSAGYFGSVDLLIESREAIFERIRNRFNLAFLQNAVAQPYDPGTVPMNDPDHPGLNLFNCYAPRAATFILDTTDTSLSEIQPALVETVGNPEGATFYMAFSRQYEESYFTSVDNDEVVVELAAIYQVFVYYFAVSPDVEIATSPESVWVTDQSEVSVRVLCGESGFRDQSIALTLGDSSIGSVTPSEGTTDEAGMFNALFSADAVVGGRSQLEASTEWSEPVSGSALTLSGSTNLEVFSLTGTWSGTGTETVSGCEAPEDNGTFQGGASFPITQNGIGISGGGFWTSFSGAVIPQSDGTFSVSGSYTDTEEGSSTGSFNGSGSAADGVLNLSWNGADSDGTCVYSGSGTATRQ